MRTSTKVNFNTLTKYLLATLLLFSCFKLMATVVPQIQYQTRDDFLQKVFSGDDYQWKLLVLNKELKQKAKLILGHRYAGSRIRYWVSETKSAWVIDELGKEMPITIGIGVEDNKITQVSILVYREERGGEVHQAYFTDQFKSLSLSGDGSLSAPVDGISGATLSVNATEKVARLALTLHQNLSSVNFIQSAQ